MEDNDADAGLILVALEEHGVEGELAIATDGERAMQMVEEIESGTADCPDLFIVDLNLPKRPGLMVLASIFKGVKCRQVPVAVLTSSDIPNDRNAVMRLGVQQYLHKPSSLQDFLALGAVFKDMLTRPAR